MVKHLDYSNFHFLFIQIISISNRLRDYDFKRRLKLKIDQIIKRFKNCIYSWDWIFHRNQDED